jgi:hypothetical protein
MLIRIAGKKLAIGLVVLIGLGCALVLTFLLVLIGIVAERIRRKREGYVPAPTSTYDRDNGLSRIPPSQLFNSLGQNRSGVEKKATMI